MSGPTMLGVAVRIHRVRTKACMGSTKHAWGRPKDINRTHAGRTTPLLYSTVDLTDETGYLGVCHKSRSHGVCIVRGNVGRHRVHPPSPCPSTVSIHRHRVHPPCPSTVSIPRHRAVASCFRPGSVPSTAHQRPPPNPPPTPPSPPHKYQPMHAWHG